MPDSISTGATDLLSKLGAKLGDLTNIHVITIIGEVSVEYKPAASPDNPPNIHFRPKDDAVVEGMDTWINMADGDIINTISSKFIEDKFKSVFDFHLEQSTRSKDIITTNVQSMVDLARRLTS